MEKAEKEQADIIYLGDSAVSHYSQNDLDKRPITQVLQEILPEYSIVSVDNAAWKADIFLEVCRYIIKQKYYPKIIVIPINMRSFSPSWDKRPGYQFEEKKAILKNKLSFMFFKTIEVFDKSDKFNEIRQDEFDNTEVFNGEEAVGKVKDFEGHEFRHYSEENMKNTILYYYMFSLKKENRLIQSLLETAKILRENNIKPVFYIAPIDYETGGRYFPGEFSERLESNTETIKSVFSENDLEILDFSTDLKTDFFAWEKYPNEHLNEKGRKYVAEKIAEIIKQELF